MYVPDQLCPYTSKSMPKLYYYYYLVDRGVRYGVVIVDEPCVFCGRLAGLFSRYEP